MAGLTMFLFVALLTVFLGGVVYINDPHKRSQRFFFLWTLFATVWMIASYTENVSSFSLFWREVLLRTDFAVSLMAGAWLMLFAFGFGNRAIPTWGKVAALLSLPMAAVCATPYLLTNVTTNAEGAIGYAEGTLYTVYGLQILFYYISAEIVLLRQRARSEGHKRAQLTWITLGLAATLCITIPINFFLQNALPLEVVRFGIYSFVFFVASVAYAVIRHEFLNVRFIVVELLLLAILANILGRFILADDVFAAVFDFGSFFVLLILGAMLSRSVLREIDQRARLEILTIKLQAANTKLKELDVLKTEFLSIASHQLRTPLAVTKGYVSMLTDGMVGKVNEKQKSALRNVAQSTESLILLVNHLLDLTRIESGRLQIRKEPVDVAALCKWTVNFLQPRADEKALKITLDIPEKVPMIEADTEKMKEVIMNLVDNAIKYTEKGTVKLALSVEHSELSIEVTDSGYGLTAQDKRHLFEKFSRGSASKNVKTTSGLGLYVCRKLVEAMGGEIRAESAGAGKGSTFIVVMPIKHRRAK